MQCQLINKQFILVSHFGKIEDVMMGNLATPSNAYAIYIVQVASIESTPLNM